jgi:hypothetical protein
MTGTATEALQRLLARSDIHDVVARYFHGVDIGDREMVRSCFTADVSALYDKRPAVQGLDALMAQIPSFEKQASGAWTVSTHFMGNLVFKQLAAAEAETQTNAFAFLVLPGTAAGTVSMRSLRYLDRLVSVEGQWKIAARVHTLDWSCEMPATFAVTMAERQGSIPSHLLPG